MDFFKKSPTRQLKTQFAASMEKLFAEEVYPLNLLDVYENLSTLKLAIYNNIRKSIEEKYASLPSKQKQGGVWDLSVEVSKKEKDIMKEIIDKYMLAIIYLPKFVRRQKIKHLQSSPLTIGRRCAFARRVPEDRCKLHIEGLVTQGEQITPIEFKK